MRNYYDDPFNGYGDDEYYDEEQDLEDYWDEYWDEVDWDNNWSQDDAKTPLERFVKKLRVLWWRIRAKFFPSDDISDIPF